ncbi:hypothetical protein [Gordonia sp. NPDC058843]|uniref:hypothetical protein n=1 Tax=Gordonia sp. NPDC058843 TaxID=3346648 RepID=UPI0036795815
MNGERQDHEVTSGAMPLASYQLEAEHHDAIIAIAIHLTPRELEAIPQRAQLMDDAKLGLPSHLTCRRESVLRALRTETRWTPGPADRTNMEPGGSS